MVNTASLEPVAPTEKETSLARESSRRLSKYGRNDLKVQIPEVGEVVLPASAVRLLNTLLSEMAAGNAVTIIPIHAELTTQQAADLLGVSRPFLIKQMQAGLIPFRKVGTHRRILFKDAMRYKQEVDTERLKALGELTDQAQELGMGY